MILFIYVSVCGYVQVNAGDYSPEKGVRSPRAGVTGSYKCLIWVSGTEFRTDQQTFQPQSLLSIVFLPLRVCKVFVYLEQKSPVL